MNGTGSVEAVYVAGDAGEPMEELERVEAVAGKGLRGDRYFADVETGKFVDWEGERPSGYDVTLIEREAVDAVAREAGIDLSPADHRRNVVTRDVPLNHLVGERFRVGDAVCRGVRLCEPCGYLENRTEDGVLDAYRHRGGLRADVVDTGVVEPGATVEPLE
jgi:hypothetical protein